MKFILFIASRLRQGQFPRLADFSHSHIFNSYIFGGKPLDEAEFNAACETIYSDRFRNQGFVIRPRTVTEDELKAFNEHAAVEAKLAKEKAEADAKRRAAAAADAAKAKAEKEAAEALAADAAAEEAAEKARAAAEEAAKLAEAIQASEEPVNEEDPEPAAEDAADAESKFVLEGTSILLNGERIAGLYGDNKQLRVMSDFSDLRPEIEAWLETINH